MKSKLKWLCFAWVVAYLLCLSAFVAWGHETHLSDMGVLTQTTIQPCPQLSGYIVTSNELECFLTYKQITIGHTALHVQPLDLNEDGICVCPTIKGTD